MKSASKTKVLTVLIVFVICLVAVMSIVNGTKDVPMVADEVPASTVEKTLEMPAAPVTEEAPAVEPENEGEKEETEPAEEPVEAASEEATPDEE